MLASHPGGWGDCADIALPKIAFTVDNAGPNLSKLDRARLTPISVFQLYRDESFFTVSSKQIYMPLGILLVVTQCRKLPEK